MLHDRSDAAGLENIMSIDIDYLKSDRSPAARREAAEDREAARRGERHTLPLPTPDLDIGV